MSDKRRGRLGRWLGHGHHAMLAGSVALLGVAVAGMLAALAQTAPKPLAANDVSILFPMPRSQADLVGLISLETLSGPSGSAGKARVWSDADFNRILAVADSDASKVDGTERRIRLPNVKTIDAWFVAGIRIDPGAPGLTPEIIAQFGQQPQVRLIVQPVTRRPDNQVQVHDIAIHLIYSYSTPSAPAQHGCLPKSQPDMEAFMPVVRDVVALRDGLAAGRFGGVNIDTGSALGVHPGLTGPSARPFRDALNEVLEKHLSPARLTTSAVMALPGGPEPWIFVALAKFGGPFMPVPNPALDGKQTAQMLSLLDSEMIIPAPVTNNLNPITCRSALAFPPGAPPLPAAERKGVSTADFLNASGVPEQKVNEIVDLIADPAKAHFFNTDCLSCHTDTRRALERARATTATTITPAVLPKSSWNVRNFGWFPGDGPTVTRRAATETADVLHFMNRELLGR